MRVLCFCIILCLSFYCCTSEDGLERNGNVLIYVGSKSGSPEDGIVGTIPVTKTSTIDENGVAVLKDIPQGVYELYASHPDLGYGSKTRSVIENRTVELEIELKNELSSNPRINLLQPIKYDSFIFGTPVTVKANLFDDKDSPPNLDIELISDIDGLLFEGNGPPIGPFEFSISTLSMGAHILSLNVKDTDGFESSHEFSIEITVDYTQFEIDSLGATQEGVYISWTKAPPSGLLRYEILRGYDSNDFVELEQFTDIENNSFYDNSVDANREIFYKINYVLESGTFMTIVRSVFYQGKSLFIGQGPLSVMEVNPKRPYIYVIEKNFWKLHFVNVEELKIDKSMSLDIPLALTINNLGDRLYVLTTNQENFEEKIVVINLNTQKVIKEINLGFGLNPDYIEWVTGDKIVLVSSFKVSMLDLGTEDIVYTSEQLVLPKIVTNSSKDELFIAHYDNSNLDLIITHFSVSSDDLIFESEFVDSEGIKEIPILSGDNKKLFIGNKGYSVEDLSDFNIAIDDEIVLASNYTGTKVAYKGGIYNAQDSENIRLFDYNSEVVISYNDYKEFVAFNQSENLMIFYKIDE